MSLVSVLGCGTWFFLIEEQLYCQELCMAGSRGVFFYPESILEGHALHDLCQVMGGT